MTVKFKLRKGKKTNSILLDLRHGRDIRFRMSTGLDFKRGSEKYWDSSRCKLKVPNDITNSTYINNRIKEIEKEIEESITILIENEKLTQIGCSNAIKKIISNEPDINDETISSTNNIVEFFEWFIKYYAVNNSPFTNKPLTSGTLRTYRNSKNYLIKFLETKKLSNFCFQDIDEKFYNDFVSYGKDKEYTTNYIGSIIQKLKTIIGYAFDKGVHNNNEFKKRYFAKFKEEINHPYLDQSELESIANLKLTNEDEKTVRDVFLIGCYTGLRVGDLMKFLKNPILINGGRKEFIYLKQNKTGGEVYIPINSRVKSILNKRNGDFPPYVHQNTINKLIKSIAKKAKINEDFILERTEGRVRKKVKKPKWKYVSTHTCRRSFCTNAYNAGMPPHHIMVISGHKSEKVFYNYIKVDLKSKAMQVAEHSFFK
ncbi:tyrosine-type recombinase/integrase [Psychroflexus sp. MES1-P1E]|uniref:tyrosine-type recombinase/integrase n=1 Tax=Psychroflexus sp. MES1-P1E TaxID=2058320 RepID=UPI000C7E1AB9|nr:site-specific integrase [Psychroflexus sp. MES1-P1E]PKG42581.1 hypothetical protein CXF67_09505 [Psychroflexus sp. MES1-P1E]